MATDLIMGLDLGQAADHSALAILSESPVLESDGRIATDHRGGILFRFDCVHLERFPLGTDYPAIIGRVEELVRSPRLQPRPRLVIDATGAGRPVVDLFLNAKLPVEIAPLTITAGSEVREARWNVTTTRAYWVPKIELVSTVQALLQTRRLRVVPRLALADVLKSELLGFKIKITSSANEAFGAWREGAHDDLVLAVAMAAWVDERQVFQPMVAVSRRFPGPASRDRPTGPTHPLARSIDQKISYMRHMRGF
jgi:hypothetical protein